MQVIAIRRLLKERCNPISIDSLQICKTYALATVTVCENVGKGCDVATGDIPVEIPSRLFANFGNIVYFAAIKIDNDGKKTIIQTTDQLYLECDDSPYSVGEGGDSAPEESESQNYLNPENLCYQAEVRFKEDVDKNTMVCVCYQRPMYVIYEERIVVPGC